MLLTGLIGEGITFDGDSFVSEILTGDFRALKGFTEILGGVANSTLNVAFLTEDCRLGL